MNKFAYKSIDSKGKITSGVLTANSELEVFNHIKERNQKPISIVPQKSESFITKDLNVDFSKVKLNDLAVTCRQLGTMLQAGIPIDRALEIQIRQSSNKALKKDLTAVLDDINSGISTSKAFEDNTDYPDILISTIRSGENIGDLDGAMNRMADHFSKEDKIQRKIRGALVYPLVVFFVTIVIATFLLVFVLPQFAEMFNDFGADLPGITVFVLNVSEFITNYWYLAILIVIAIVVLFIAWKKTETGKHQFGYITLRIPVIKKFIQQIVTARFTRTMSTLVESGISIIDALEMAAKTTNNAYVESKVGLVVNEVKKGASVSFQLRQINLFPEMMLSLISVGEETGQMGSLLNQTADFYDEEFEMAMDNMVSLIEPFMILIVGAVVGVIVVAMYLPMIDLYTIV